MNLDSSKPLYLQIEADIKNSILSKKYKPGEKLPTENVLSEQYDVSKITIRKAIQKLSDEGFVKKVQGKGTFVTYQKEKLVLNKTSGFKEALSTKGHSAKNEVIQASFLNADKTIAEKLSIPINTKIVYLERLVWEDNEPMALDKIYFENDKFPDFITKLDDNLSFYQILEESYAIKPKNSILEINGISANSHQADLLKCNIGDPLFYINKISYDENNKPIHFSLTTIRCDRITYVVYNNDSTTTNEKIKS